MASNDKTCAELEREIQELRQQLDEARETFRAIREGDLDALVIQTAEGEKIFTIEGADQAYRTIVEEMQEGAVTVAADGSIRYCNRRFADVLRLPIDQIIGHRFREFVAEADRGRFDQLVRDANGGSARAEVVLASGKLRVPAYLGLSQIVANGIASLCIAITDLSERKWAEQVLASERYSRAILNQALDGIVVCDTQGRPTFVNAAARRLARLDPAGTSLNFDMEIWGKRYYLNGQPILPDDLSFVRALRGEATVGRESRMVREDGTEWFTLINASPLRDADGRIFGAVSTFSDITERVRAEQALQRSNEELRTTIEELNVSQEEIAAQNEELQQAQEQAQLAKHAAEEASRAKDHFLAALSHELRTPLTPVLTTVQMMEMDKELPSAWRESVGMIRRNVELEARLIDDLLDLTRISRGKLELHLQPTDLHKKLHNVIEICDSDIRARQLHLNLELDASQHHVLADPARLQQILWNILRNAVKFTPAGGSITVTTRNAKDRRIAVVVSDTGIGIEPELVQRLFQPFEQGEQNGRYGGLGLGLSISKGLVDLHRGTISAFSEGRGKGATFTLELPTCAPAAEAKPPSPHAVSKRPTNGRILLVEDHADTARSMGQLLQAFGYQVQTANSVASALALALREEFDLLVSDIGLPDGSGLDLMRRLPPARRIKAVALSGYGQEEDLRRSQEAGFAEHITKPIDIKEFEETIRRLLS